MSARQPLYSSAPNARELRTSPNNSLLLFTAALGHPGLVPVVLERGPVTADSDVARICYTSVDCTLHRGQHRDDSVAPCFWCYAMATNAGR